MANRPLGVAGDNASLRLVLALRHGDQELHHFGITQPISPDLVKASRSCAGSGRSAGAADQVALGTRSGRAQRS
jgi:hypothetical protein